MTDVLTQLQTNIDFEQDGKQCDYLRLPHSVDRSAYGWLPIPLVCIKNGEGPTMLLMGGNHGDEFEGQVALTKLIKEIEPQDISGRLIILPMANYPAAKAGRRISPLDQGNLNRTFPGDPTGTPTWKISHYIEAVLLRMADYMVDLHCGGNSMVYLPSILMERPDDVVQFKKSLELLMAFGAPYGIIEEKSLELDSTSSAAATRKGVLSITAETGGGGTVSPDCLRLCERGVRNVLHHSGILRMDPSEMSATSTELLRVEEEHFIYAESDGLFEPVVGLGDRVVQGQLAGLIHTPEMPWQDATAVHFDADGIVVCKRIPGCTERGDFLFHLGVVIGG